MSATSYVYGNTGADVDPKTFGSAYVYGVTGLAITPKEIAAAYVYGKTKEVTEQFTANRTIYIQGVKKEQGDPLDEDDIRNMHRFRRYVKRGYIVFEGDEGYYATRHMTILGQEVEPGDEIDIDSLHYPEPFKRPHRSARPEE